MFRHLFEWTCDIYLHGNATFSTVGNVRRVNLGHWQFNGTSNHQNDRNGTGHFDLGNSPASPALNYVGLLFVIIGGILFALVPPKTQQQNESAEERVEDRESLLDNDQLEETERHEGRHGDGQSVAQIRQGQTTLNQRIIAIVLSVFAGICYGSIFTPVVYMQDNPEKFHPPPPKGGIYYVFPHFSGVYLTSTAVLIIYIAYKKNRPYIDNRLIFPSFLAGVLWAFGTLAWFWANDILSQAITFPITEVANEHLKLYIAAMFLSIIGVTMVGLSKSV
uniref:Uncharacterized protein n=1 Tax=Globodera rostochiensis TaxID=31243 RepID=A0A914I347_GLORO